MRVYTRFMRNEVTLRIVLQHPPDGVDFGVQKGKGTAYETVQAQRSSGNRPLQFEIAVDVKIAAKGPALAGPYVQGPPDARFLYLDIGTYAGQNGTPWGRRLKIPLTGITAGMLEDARILEARVPGTGKDGGPNCGAIKPFDGWKIKHR
jgi:Family of unknown function (DUF5990)